MENGQKNWKNDLSMMSSLFHRVKISILFRISDLGLTWRDFPVTLYCRCNTSEAEAIELSPCNPACPGATCLNQTVKSIRLYVLGTAY